MRISDLSSDVCSSDLKPRPLNPNMKLKGIADERNWPVQRFASRGTPSWVDYTRTIYATGSTVGAFAAGLPIWALTRSQREAVNVSLGSFGDFATAIPGVEREVTDDPHIWSTRPCVIIFNQHNGTQ